MQRFIFLSLIFLSPAFCFGQIAIVDQGTPWAQKTTTTLSLSEPVTISADAGVLKYAGQLAAMALVMAALMFMRDHLGLPKNQTDKLDRIEHQVTEH